MRNFEDDLIPALWGMWLLYWCIAALTAKPVRRRESVVSGLSHMVPLCIGIALLLPSHFPNMTLSTRFLPRSGTGFWTGAGLVAAGLLFSVAARRSLGGNWSGSVTVKQDHTLTRDGPYRFVRHPIYTGLLLAIPGSVIAAGEVRGLLALGLIAVALRRKISIEEQFLLEQFGPAYARYCQEVAALIPGVL